MPKWEHNIPSVPNPVGDMCVQVFIPAHPDYIKLFVRAVRQLENNRLYQRDEENGAIVKVVQAQWRNRTVTPLIEALATGTGICGVDGECLAYPPFANFISYFPQNPYTEPDLIPPDFLAPPFYINGKDPEHTLPNYNNGDVIVNFAAINLEPSWNLDNTPRIELCLEGSGVCEIHFLNIVQGGVAVVSLDNPVDLGDIISGVIGDGIDSIDLNQDIISLPPETSEEIIIEVEVPTEGEHIIYIYFLPTVNDSLIPLQFGGGLREISLCGNLRPCGTPPEPPPPPLEGVTELKPEFQFTPDCGMEYRLRDQEDNIVQDWIPVPGWIENFADCVGGAGMATKDDIRDGIYEAFNRLAMQVASGRYNNISIDEDGNVSDPSDAAGEDGLPPDDPETEADETSEARAGGAIAVTAGYNKIWSDMNTWKTAGLTADVVSYRLQQKYEMVDDASTDNFVALYFAIYATGHINSYTEALSEMLFCGAGNFKNIVAEYIIDSVTLVLQENAFALNAALADSQITTWFNAGVEVPSTDYRAYSCVKIPDEVITLDMSTGNTVSKTTNGVWKNGHRMRIRVSGTFADSDLPLIVGDGMYNHTTDTGTKSYIPLTFNAGGGTSAIPQENAPFQASHIYEFTLDKSPGSSPNTCIISKDNGSMATPNITGVLTVEIFDEGEFAL